MDWSEGMKTVKVTTPENIEIEYRLAGLGSRGAAAVIDLSIQVVVILTIILTLFALQINPKDLIDEYSGWVIGGIILLIWFIIYGYFIIFEMVMNGRTPGKKLFNLRTIRSNGQPITIKHSIIRNLFRIIIDTYGVGIITMFFSKQHKRVGDYVGSTIVIAEEKKDDLVAIGVEMNKNYNYKYSISNEEYQLLKEYHQRKNSLEESKEELEKELGEYFAKRLEVLKNENEYEKFLDEILKQATVSK